MPNEKGYILKSTEGYTDDMPVVYINENKKTDLTLPDIPQFDEVCIYPYQYLTHHINKIYRKWKKKYQ